MKRILIGIVAGLLFGALAAIAADNFNVLDKLNLSFSTATITGQLAPANGGSGVANSKNLTWSNSLTLAGTDATTMTFPTTSATIARTDAANTFTGAQTFSTSLTAGGTISTNYVGSFQGTGGNVTGTVQNVFDVTQDHTTYRGVAFGYDSSGQIGVIAAQTASAASSIAFYNYTGGAWVNTLLVASGLNTSKVPLLVSTGATANQVRTAQTTAPTCTTNCGTSPSVLGTDTAGVITMGGTGVPASGFVLTFNGTWTTQGPACSVTPALATMVVGKLPIAVVTNQTTMTVTTNGTAPANSDKYQYVCVGVS